MAAEYFILVVSERKTEKMRHNSLLSSSSGADDEGAIEGTIQQTEEGQDRNTTGMDGWGGERRGLLPVNSRLAPPARIKEPMANGAAVGPGTAATVAAAVRGG